MDFHSLTRKELQFLCKLNKIPANTKNQVMEDALRGLDIVEGIEKFIKVSQSQTVDLDESKENVEVSPPRVPATRNRTTTRQKEKTTEVENLQPKNTRTTRRTAKKVTGGVEESNNDVLETPALSSTRRKALATSSCRNVNSQLNDCELDAKEVQNSSAAAVTMNRRKVATTSTTVKKETTVQKTYGTRRSTRQTEKKSGEPRVRKESEKAVEIISLLDEDDSSSDEVLTIKVPEITLNEGIPNAEVEDMCNAMEELDVDMSGEKEVSSEVDNMKPEADDISDQHEEGNVEEEPNDSVLDENTNSTGSLISDDNMILDTTENPNEALNSLNENKCSLDEETTNDKVSENMEDESSNVIAAIDSISPVIEGVEVHQPEFFSVNSKLNVADLMVDEVNATSEKNLAVAKLEEEEENVIPDAKMEDVFNSFEKLDVVDNLKLKSNEITNPCEIANFEEEKLELIQEEHSESFIEDSADVDSNETSKPSENVEFEEEKIEFIPDESVFEDNADVDSDETSKPSENVEFEEEKIEFNPDESFLEDNADVDLDETSKPSENSDFKEEKRELIPEEHSQSFIEDNADVDSDETSKPSENSDFEKEKRELIPEEHSQSFLEDNADVDSTSARKTPATSSSRNVNSQLNDCEQAVVTSSRRKVATPSTTLKKVATLQKEISYKKSTRSLTEKKSEKSTEKVESEKVVKFDLMLDEHVESFPDDDDNADMASESEEINEKADSDSWEEEENQLITEIGVPTSMKKMTSFVSDDKENKINKEKDGNVVIKSLENVSLRQLRKKLKALNLKAINAKNQEARPALQTLCENQMVGGEKKN